MKKIPSYIARCLWPYDLSKINLQRDKELIITQVLNYGDLKGIKWLYRNYPERVIKDIVKNPSRGVWFKKVLNFWHTLFNIHLPKKKIEQAIFRLDPKEET